MNLCDCGCGLVAKPGKRFIRGHNGKLPSNRSRISEVGKRNKGHIPWCKGLTKETDERIRVIAQKISENKERGKKISRKLKGRPKSEEHKRKLRGPRPQCRGKPHPHPINCTCCFCLAKRGEWRGCKDKKFPVEEYPNFGNRNKKFSELHKYRIKIKHLGKRKPPLTEKAKRKISVKTKGENNPNWKGGIGKEPYPFEFDEVLKEGVRKKYNRKCFLCGKPELRNKVKLDIHHIDYNKKNCSENNLIPLCKVCNPKVNYHREFWVNYFQTKLKEGVFDIH